MPSPQGRDPEIWQRIDALLSEALTLPESERESWLERLSRSDETLASTLREMLSRSETTDSFLRTPVSPEVLAVAGEVASLEEAGTTIGPYRLLRVLGAGGMGQVWLADRIDGTLHREVALKLPRTGWAPGLAERLNQERDALAALEHPHIARLYDAGTTAEGRPYLAMEYVDGVPFDRYAAAHHLTLRERLELFLQVAGAVSYAHAHLVVHRDLKPSNILVSEARGVRLLDFGAAKLLREDGPGDSDLTRELGPALSPDYASPEQIRGERVTVATDVYSLGVVLYELLTGQRPYRLPRRSWAALIEAMRTLEVPLASASTAADPRLARALRGDLDAVLSKALRKDAAERYPSVQAVADDVARFLAGEPVLAKAQGAVERAWKFVRRNAMAVTTAAAVLLVVGAAAGVALWQARVARAQAARAERVRGFIASILTSATPRTGVGGVVTATDLLGAAAGRIESELSGEPGVAAELGVLVAQSFESLGETAKEEPVLRAAIPR
ncbi:MAG: serine/threonine-protein kinase, partial [Myxococcaceae bacterium]